MVDFKVAACDAHTFGVMLHVDKSGKGHRLQFIPQGNGLFTVILMTDFPPLDDFWADQYKMYIPRPVDGPELVRHDNVSLVDGVFLFLRGQIVEVFCGGRALSFRLPEPPNWADSERDGVRRLGWYVEDGMVDLVDINMRHSMSKEDGLAELDNLEDAE
jgi:beta-fructofuranosidase